MIGHTNWCAFTPTRACTCGGYYPDASATPTLTEFLLARIAEDEADVRDPAAALHFAPARVLAECEAKRGAIEAAWVDWCQIVNEFGNGGDRDELSAQHDNPAVLCHLALPFAGHPDYREEWKP